MSDLRKNTPGVSPDDSNWLELVTQQVRAIRYGVVEIVIHDGRVIQVEKTERVRFDKKPGDKRPE